jgi:hypothetical protein
MVESAEAMLLPSTRDGLGRWPLRDSDVGNPGTLRVESSASGDRPNSCRPSAGLYSSAHGGDCLLARPNAAVAGGIAPEGTMSDATYPRVVCPLLPVWAHARAQSHT